MTSQAPSPVCTPNPFTDREFRDAMGRFPTGVCVVTAKNAYGESIGMTVNSFTSVSLNPPLVLVCLGEESPRAQAIINAGQFNISILTQEQIALSSHFAQPGQGLADDGMVEAGQNGSPVVPHSGAVVECNFHAQYPGGDHIILVGCATHLTTNLNAAPLMYFGGGYKQVGDEA